MEISNKLRESSNSELAEQVRLSPHLLLPGETAGVFNMPRNPHGIAEQKEAYWDRQAEYELVRRLGRQGADRVILAADALT